MKQTIKFGKARCKRFRNDEVGTFSGPYTARRPIVTRIGVRLVK